MDGCGRVGYGNHGRVVDVDLTTGVIKERRLPNEYYRKFIGGAGLAAKILFEETDASTDPLGPGNLLILMAGPLTGTSAPLSGRHAVVARSPLTGLWGESDVGGSWGYRLKRAGWDGIIVRGQAVEPCYIYVEDSHVEVRDACDLWGKDTFQTHEILQNILGAQNLEITCIGQGGENLVRLACVASDGVHGRMAGRCGLGAVMGSKKLKAVAVRGSGAVPVGDAEALREVSASLSKKIRATTQGYHDFGTSGQTVAVELIGDLPVKNWKLGSWKEGAPKISGRRMAETMLTGRYSCRSCFVQCGRVVRVSEGPYASVECGGPEYETVALLGSLLLIDDLNAIQYMNELCNRYGLDTISTGGVIGFAFEAAERGLLKEWADYSLRWGDADCVIRLIKEIAFGTGLGKILGEGSRRAAEIVGHGSESFAVHVKGLEFPGHDPRSCASLAVAYATSNRGACHVQALSHIVEKTVKVPEIGFPEVLDRFSAERKGTLVARMQNLMGLFDSLKMCKFVAIGGSVSDYVGLLNAVTGYGMSVEEFLRAGERIFNLKRLFNIRLGVDRGHDTLPPRAMEPTQEGGAKGYVPPLETMLDEYYAERGWSSRGIPLKETLERLDLKDEGSRVGI